MTLFPFIVASLLFLFTGHAFAAGMLSVPIPSQDWGLSWINYLFFGTPINVLNGAINTGVSGACSWQSGLSKALGYYSSGMLVLAGVLLLYHLTAMIAETAHSGTPMGKNANQIWAPLRLVFAIGLLVPIGTSDNAPCTIVGLNAGQYIVIQMAKWGSGLASNVWGTFTNNVNSQLTANTVTACPKGVISEPVSPSCVHVSPMAQTFALGMVGNLACMYFYNQYVMILDGSGNSNIQYNSGSHLIGKEGAAKICGGYVPVDAAKLASNAYSGVYAAQQTVVDKYVNGPFKDYAKIYAEYFYRMNGLPGPPANDSVLHLVQQFQTDLDNVTQAAAQAADVAQAEQNARNNAFFTESGWLSAGVWINSISRLQAERSDSIQNGLPQLVAPTLPEEVKAEESPLGDYLSTEAPIHMDIKSCSRSALGDLNAFNKWLMPENGSSAKALAAAAMAGSPVPTGSGIGASVFNAILILVDKVAGWTNVWNDSGALAIKFDKSRNPLAEIATFGQNVVGTSSSLIGWGATIYTGSGLAKLLGYLPGVGSILSLLGNGFSVAATLIIGIGVVLLGAGILLVYVLPLVPFIRFFFASLTWIIGVAEAVVAAPLLALAHLSPEGDGLPGAYAKQGYFFILNIFLRPVLMIFGLIIGVLLFNVGIGFLNGMFLFATQGTDAATTQAPALSRTIFTIMYCALAYVLGNNCFKSIGMFPEYALRWLGSSGHIEKMGDHGTVLKAVGITGAYLGGKEVITLAKAPGDALAGIGGHIQNQQRNGQQLSATKNIEQKSGSAATTGGNSAAGGNARQMPPCSPGRNTDSPGTNNTSRNDPGLPLFTQKGKQQANTTRQETQQTKQQEPSARSLNAAQNPEGKKT
jgi:conjugal transfer/type IV secretion protein DotA/TraY